MSTTGRIEPGKRSEKAVLLLGAAQELIQLYNSGSATPPVAFTLAKTLADLGKRGEAVEVLRQLLETTNLGQKNMAMELPFLFPFFEQNVAPIKTDAAKWLMVRTIESWVLLKDVSTFWSGNQEQKMIHVLEGNPEVSERFKRVTLANKLKRGAALVDDEESILAEITSFKNTRHDRSKTAGAESTVKTSEERSVSQKRVFTRKFWNEKFTAAKAEKVVNMIRKFKEDEFGANVLSQVLKETEKRIEEAGSDNAAFFIQTHALLALSSKKKGAGEVEPVLANALQEKGWGDKSELYSYWFDGVLYRREVDNPQVSAIIISNRFKEKSVENFKRLSDQLSGSGEIIFVNNGASDDEFKPLMDYVDTVVKTNGNSGAYLARNLGALFAKGKTLLFVDDDGIPDDGFVDAHIEIQQDDEIVVARGACYSGGENDPPHYDLGDKVIPAPTHLEGNTSIQADTFFEISGWGDYILFGHGGVDLGLRLANHNYKQSAQVYTPKPRLQHAYSVSETHLKEKLNKQNTSFMLVKTLNGGAAISGKRVSLSNLRTDKSDTFIHFCYNHIYAQSLSDLIEHTNKVSDQQHWLFVESEPTIPGFDVDVSQNPSTILFDSRVDLDGLLKELRDFDTNAIYMHGLFRSWQFRIVDKLGSEKHISWVIWGNDLYGPVKNNPRSFPAHKIKSINSAFEGDRDLFKKHFHQIDDFEFGYPIPGLYKRTGQSSEAEKSNIILVGNSLDPSNNHIEILNELASKKDVADYKIILPVSYGNYPEYKKELLSHISNMDIRESIELYEEFLTPDEYATLISKSKLLIMAHHRQKAMGNIIASLYFGNATFFRKHITIKKGEHAINPGWATLESDGVVPYEYDKFSTYESISDIPQYSSEEANKIRKTLTDRYGIQTKSDQLIRACRAIADSNRKKQTV